MTNGTAPLSQEQIAERERATQDIQAANETGRAVIQATILINGGAATALLAYLSKDTTIALQHAAAWSLAIYAFGVLCAVVSMWCQTQALAQFAYYREAKLGADPGGAVYFFKKGDRWLSGHRTWFLLSILCFIGASWWMAREFFRAT